MTQKSDDLALCIINTGEGYKDRCEAARRPAHIACMNFFGITARAAVYSQNSDEPLSAAEILDAAAQVAAYYAEHIKEL